MSKASPSVTVSIVSHGQWSMVRPLVDQLHQHCRTAIARIVVTINVPESIELSPNWDLPLEITRNYRPRGFGANHNHAFAHCNSAWFLVLNPDIRLSNDLISGLLTNAAPQAGLLTPRIHEPGKAQAEPFRNLLTPLELVRRRSSGYVHPNQPAWVAGMFMLLRSEAFKQVKGFDERYFMYCEDFDLCARLRLAGWDIQVVPHLCVIHDAQRASNRSLRPLYWHLRSLFRVWLSGTFWRYFLFLQRSGSTLR